jgi:hypothetical protein
VRRKPISAIWLSSALLFPFGVAGAQTPSPVGEAAASQSAQSFAPEYFTQFSPQTAADMVARLPGFEISGSNNGSRGFGQASLNILINGRRPSSKSSSARDILSRIPASNVTRIDIVDGSTLDVAGLSGQVANIIAKTGELSGSWNYAARFEQGSQPQLGDGGVSFSAKQGRLEAVGSVNFGHFSFTEDGDETFFDGSGNVTQDRVEKLGFNTQEPSADLNLTFSRDNGDIANLNLSGGLRNRNTAVQETFTNRADADLSGRSVAENGDDRERYEISGDYSFDIDGFGRDGRLKLIGLNRAEAFQFSNRFTIEDLSSGQSRFLFNRDDVAKEYIARTEYTFKTGETNDWSLALETALNTLESDTDFLNQEVSLVQEDVHVEEERYQANLARSWALDDRTNIQTSIGAEYSILSGDVTTFIGPDFIAEDTTEESFSESFFRPKGLINVSRKLDESWTLRSQLERRVGQLDFGTFVSGVNFAAGTETSGGKIVPTQVWDAELELQRQNGTGLSGTLMAFYEIIEDPIVQVLFDDGSQGPANLDSNAQVYGLQANLTWVLDDVLKGLRLTADGVVADSSIEDVITSENRSRSRQGLWEYEVSARWDINDTPYAIETEIEQGRRDTNFRIDEFSNDAFIRPEFEISLIHKTLFGMQWTATLQNIVDFEFRRERFLFDGDRTGDLTGRELFTRKRGQRFSIAVTDTF